MTPLPAQRYPSAVAVTLELAPFPASVGEARRFTVQTLRGWGRDDLTSTGALLVTELVTNAILHARTVVQVYLERRGNSVRLEVRDGSPVKPALRSHGLDATTGRGLALVSHLAESWGVEMGSAGKVVWAHLAEDSGEAASELVFFVPNLEDEAPGGPDAAAPGSADAHEGTTLAGPVPALGLCA